MAQTVSDEQLNELVARTGFQSIYSWDTWLNGQTWELIKGPGKDYSVSTVTIQRQAHHQARKRGLKLTTRQTRNGRGLMIRAYKP